MPRLLSIITLAVLNAQSMQPADATDDFQRRLEERRSTHEQRVAEMRKRFDERRSQPRSRASSTVKPPPSTTTAKTSTNSTSSTISRPSLHNQFPEQSERMRGTTFNPLPFDAAHAPAPDLCLLKFVQSARAASHINQIMSFLPYAKQKILKECQEQYDPLVAAKHRSSFAQQPKMTTETLDHLTSDPYTRELKRLRRLAEKIIRVKDTKIKGNKAVLKVATHAEASQNGDRYPYGTAVVEMIGEGNYWRFASYNDDNVFYKKPQ